MANHLFGNPRNIALLITSMMLFGAYWQGAPGL
jgi:hypothetical protein